MRIVWGALFIACVFIIWFFLKLPGYAHFADRPDLNGWFDGLASQKGLCCSFADGHPTDPDDIDTVNGHYRVRLDGEWVDVPDSALVLVPNRFGQPVVWPWKDSLGKWQIRCFMPGAGI